MLKVQTYIAQSRLIPEAGIGLFAKQDINEGDVIWEYDPLIDRSYTEEEFNQIQNSNIFNLHFLNTYCYKEGGHYILCVDNGRFINHSEDFYNTTERKLKTIAKRKIFAGEEIISNYLDFSSDVNDKQFNSII